METINSFEGFELNDKLKELVVARIKASIKPNIGLSIGSMEGSISRDQMIENVLSGSSVGKQIAFAHLNFIKAQASGQLTELLNSI
jgi:hypothetical protein